MKTDMQLREAAIIQLGEARRSLDRGEFFTVADLWKLQTMLRVALAAVTELRNRAAGNPPGREGQ